MSVEKRFGSLADLAVITGLSKSALRHHIRSGHIRVARKLGRRLLFDLKDFWSRETEIAAHSCRVSHSKSGEPRLHNTVR